MSVPSWLTKPGPILIKRHTRTSKNELLVEKADLMHATPSYAYTKVSLKNVTPFPADEVIDEVDDEYEIESFEVNVQALHHFHIRENSKEDNSQIENNSSGQSPPERSDKTIKHVFLKRSTRARKTPYRLMYK